MNENQIQMLLEQLKTADLFSQIPGYKELPKKYKEEVLNAFQTLISDEKAKVANEQ